jgi:tRNA-specific 2-thiouridylase
MQDISKDKRILVGMSGGLDSSVAAALLVQNGYRVTGVTMKTWAGRDMPVGPRHGCYGPGEEDDIADAAKVAKKLGIDYRVIDLSAEFETEVLDYFCREYKCGRTPSPCLVCNSRIKFGGLWSAAAGSGIQFDYFATGHYARCQRDPRGGRYLLKKGKDLRKDQSYFLAFLKQEQLTRVMFPLGEYTKHEVRAIAAEMGLEVRDKPESQDFIGFDYHELLEDMPAGPITDAAGKRLGTHRGLGLYTVGQRKGLDLSSGPYYVTRIDAESNTIIVGRKDDLLGSELVASRLNWIAIDRPGKSMKLTAKIRYQHTGAEAEVVPLDSDRVKVRFTSPQSAIAPGQAVVFYNGPIVVGGGIIDRDE